MTLRDLVLAAGGTEIETFPDRAHVARLREDLSRELLRYELDPDDMGIPLTEIPLEPGDRVSLFNRSDLLLPQDVSIYGLVKEPGTYSLAEGMTVEDLILTAGGFRKGARSLEVEVARLHISPERTDTIASVIRVALRGDPVLDGDGNGTQDGTQDGTSARVRDVSRETGPDWTLADWSPAADEFALEDGDRVFVRRLPGYVTPATVEVVGQVLYPGSYGLERRDETLSSVIRRAGGLTEDAYVAGFRLLRDGLPVAGDLEDAMKEPGGSKDLALRSGDRLVVPEYDPTVLVTGAVAFESRIIWRGGRGVDDYVSRAGGFTQDADEGRLSVSYLNGERDTPGRFLFWRSYPNVEPGSTIYVPVKPEDEGFDWDTFLTRALSVVGTVATVIAVTR